MEATPDYDEALALARTAHAGQVRAGSGLPYVTHPVAVAEALRADGQPLEVVVAGLLHDTVEDTDVTLDEVRSRFGDEVAALVDAVTRRDDETYVEFVERVAVAGPGARALKRADVTHNLSDLPDDKASLRGRYERALGRLSA